MTPPLPANTKLHINIVLVFSLTLSDYVKHTLYVLMLQEAVKNALMHCQQSADAAPLPVQAMYGLAALCRTAHAENTCREHMQRTHIWCLPCSIYLGILAPRRVQHHKSVFVTLAIHHLLQLLLADCLYTVVLK